MTAPQEPNALPFEPSTAEFGPDPTVGPQDVPLPTDPPKVNQKNPPRSTKSVFRSLGANKKPRSGIRKLDDKDREKIVSLYVMAAMPIQMFKPKVAAAMATSADACADAWIELANENDSVRRALLMLIEGGVWGKVFAAHTPILFAAIPDNFVPPWAASMSSEDPNGEADE